MREGQGDDAAHGWRGPARVGTGMRAGLRPPGEAVHQALRGSLGGGGFGLDKALRAGDPDAAEAELSGSLLEFVGQGHLTLA